MARAKPKSQSDNNVQNVRTRAGGETQTVSGGVCLHLTEEETKLKSWVSTSIMLSSETQSCGKFRISMLEMD